jgi:hypothetical protein
VSFSWFSLSLPKRCGPNSYNRMGPEERSGTRWWHKTRFGGKTPEFNEIRIKISMYTSAITMSLNLCRMDSIGQMEAILRKVEANSSASGQEIRGMTRSLHWVTAKMLVVREEGSGSVWTSYTNDDKEVWRTIRREMVKSGFTSSVLHENKSLIKEYLEELGNRGIFDDYQGSSVENTLLAKARLGNQEDESAVASDSGFRQDGCSENSPQSKTLNDGAASKVSSPKECSVAKYATSIHLDVSTGFSAALNVLPSETEPDGIRSNLNPVQTIPSQLSAKPTETAYKLTFPETEYTVRTTTKIRPRGHYFHHEEECIDEPSFLAASQTQHVMIFYSSLSSIVTKMKEPFCNVRVLIWNKSTSS